MTSTKKITTILASLFLLLCFIPATSLATWQETLEQNFDIIETFDELNDWKGSARGANILSHPNDFPTKNNGSPSIWQHYSYYGKLPAPSNWIQDHGQENVWQGTGKSLALDYQEGGAELTDLGPSRLGFKIGSSPFDGYHDEVFVFFMTKWFRDFFKSNSASDGILTSESDFGYTTFLKTLDISAGFESIELWGTDNERIWLTDNCPPGYPSTQALNIYGFNAQVYNFSTGASFYNQEVIATTILYTQQPGESLAYCHYNGSTIEFFKDAKVGGPIFLNEWFGIEYRLKTSNPHGASNGEIEIWVYDKHGNQIGHQLKTGLITFKDGPAPFNHGWNKFVWGGNRYDSPGYPTGQFGPVEHFYVDDIIVNGARIGPTYFGLITPRPSILDVQIQ